MASAKFIRIAAALAFVLGGAGAHGEIYKWVDAQGQVHFSDKRYANEKAKRIDAEVVQEQQNPNQFVFYPDADALLQQNQKKPLGTSTALSAGHSQQGQNISLIRFDVASLLEELHRNPNKKLLRATLRLYANADDRLYGQNTTAEAGHFGKNGDNAFYLKPVHNNFEEKTVTWADFFDQSHYTPAAVRNLPSVTAPSSNEDNLKDYEIDVLPLIQQLMAANLRQFTLEMRLQRTSGRGQVTFFSREADPAKRPSLTVELFSEQN
ncbi:DNRLRE domain-containing protein [Saccharophagus sp. K07]|uniref:DNRLRE domain-containing protein n=1 Tax=Saccharophagus sp. K07 TaxID=2283636 RepID=UPI0016528814|nr:DNRLRE domain-containing protein [Saccharophagus sp. K07]